MKAAMIPGPMIEFDTLPEGIVTYRDLAAVVDAPKPRSLERHSVNIIPTRGDHRRTAEWDDPVDTTAYAVYFARRACCGGHS